MDQAPADTELRNIIDKLAQFVARNGPEFEQMTKNKQKDNPKFSFLFGGEYFNYYQYKVTTEQAILKQKGINPMQNADPRLNVSQQQQQSAVAVNNVGVHQNNGLNSVQNNMGPAGNPPHMHGSAPGHPNAGPGHIPPGRNPVQQNKVVRSSIQLQNDLTNLQAEQSRLQDLVRQSEQNLAAQHAALIAQQQGKVEDTVRQAQENALQTHAQNTNTDLATFDSVLQPIIDSCTKDSISAGKAWILQHSITLGSNQVIAEHLLKRVIQETTFTHKLHIIYLVNDVLHHCARKKSVDLRKAMESVVVPMFCNTSLVATEDQLNKLNKLLSLWESKSNYFEEGIIEKLKDPSRSWSEYQTSLMTQHAGAITSITATTKQTFDSYQAQHQAFVNHAMSKIQELEDEKIDIDRQLKAPPSAPIPNQQNVPLHSGPPPMSGPPPSHSGPPPSHSVPPPSHSGPPPPHPNHPHDGPPRETGLPYGAPPIHDGPPPYVGPPPHDGPPPYGGPPPHDGGPPPYGGRSPPYGKRPHDERSSYGGRLLDEDSPYGQRSPPYGGRSRDEGPPFASRSHDEGPPYSGRSRDDGPPYGGRLRDDGPPYGGRSLDDGPPYGRSREEGPPYRRDDGPPYGGHPRDDGPPYGREDGPPYGREDGPPYHPLDEGPYGGPLRDGPPYGSQPRDGRPPYGGQVRDGGPPYGGPPRDGGPPYGGPPRDGPPYGGQSRDGPYGGPHDGPPYAGPPHDGGPPYGAPHHQGHPHASPPHGGLHSDYPPHRGPPLSNSPYGPPHHGGPHGVLHGPHPRDHPGMGPLAVPPHAGIPPHAALPPHHHGGPPPHDLNFSQPPPNWSHPGVPPGPPGPPPNLPLPDLSKPPPGFGPPTGGPPGAPPPLMAQEVHIQSDDLMPSMPYFELPAGLMVPLIKLEHYSYKPLDPDAIRLPSPAAPSDRLIAAVEAFYAPPNHDSPRDSDGWEKLGLYEYYRAKNLAKKRKEDDIKAGVREKSRSPSPILRPRSRSPSPPKKRYRSKSKSKSRSRSPRERGRSRSRSPPSSTTPNHNSRRNNRNSHSSNRNRRRRNSGKSNDSQGRSPDRRLDRSERSPTPPSFLGSTYSKAAPDSSIDESNKGHQLLRKMGWGGAGLGANEQGIEAPISGGDVRDRSDQYKGVGISLNDPYENFRKHKGQAFITRMKARAEERAEERGDRNSD